VVNYRDRESAYRNSNYSWARNVRHRPSEGTYRQPGGSYRPPYSDRNANDRPDYRSRQTFDRNPPNSQTWSPSGTNRAGVHTPDSRADRDRHQSNNFRPTGNLSPQQSERTYSRQESREFRPESARLQSRPSPQPSRSLEMPRENRSRNTDQPRGQAPPSDSSDKKTDSWNPKRKGLRSLGDA
jgi:hypothetical protein